MIKNRLNVLMAERNLTIKDINENTTLSRTTISNMINGVSDGLQMKTLDILCNYLEITPIDFFEYAPYLFSFDFIDKIFYVEVKSGNKFLTYSYDLYFGVDDVGYEEEYRLKKFDLYICIASAEYNDPFLPIFNTLSIGLKNEFVNNFISFVLEKLSNMDILEEVNISKATDELEILIRTPFKSLEKRYNEIKQ